MRAATAATSAAPAATGGIGVFAGDGNTLTLQGGVSVTGGTGGAGGTGTTAGATGRSGDGIVGSNLTLV